MAFDEVLAARVREELSKVRGITERKMFGGICFMLNGNMVGGVLKNDLIIKIGKEAHERVAGKKHVRPFDFAGKPMLGIVYVAAGGVKTRKQLEGWLKLGLAEAGTRAPK